MPGSYLLCLQEHQEHTHTRLHLKSGEGVNAAVLGAGTDHVSHNLPLEVPLKTSRCPQTPCFPNSYMRHHCLHGHCLDGKTASRLPATLLLESS